MDLNVTSDAGGNLAIVEGDGLTNSSGEVDFNGLQLVTLEPASLTQLGLGCALLGRARKAIRRA